MVNVYVSTSIERPLRGKPTEQGHRSNERGDPTQDSVQRKHGHHANDPGFGRVFRILPFMTMNPAIGDNGTMMLSSQDLHF